MQELTAHSGKKQAKERSTWGGDDSWTPLAAECGQGRTGRGQPSRRSLHEVRLQR